MHFLVNRVVWRRETKQFLYAGTLALLCLQGALYEAHRLDFIPATAFVTLAIAWGMGYVRACAAAYGGKLRRVRERVALRWRDDVTRGYREPTRIAEVVFDEVAMPASDVQRVLLGTITSETSYGTVTAYPVYAVCRDVVFELEQTQKADVAAAVATVFANELGLPLGQVFGNPLLRGTTMAGAVVMMLAEMFGIALVAFATLMRFEATLAAACIAGTTALLNEAVVRWTRAVLRPRADEKVRDMFGIA
ncbi:MAG: hypothetical protein R3B40_19245 [Polyangiales bacterium]|nr:hypothetical protein [Sandaracinaceae bacterium]